MNVSNTWTRKKWIARRKIFRILVYVGIIVMCLWAVFPLFWMGLLSFKEPIHSYDPSVWIFKPVINNYISVFTTKNFGKYLLNSSIVAVSATLLAMVIGTLAAYGFSRFKFRHNQNFLFVLLSIRMIPGVSIVIPVFLIASFLRILDSRLLLIVVYQIITVPFTVWMMKGFFDEIPIELEEAAMIDGCTSFQSLYRIILPVVQPGLVATSIFCLITSWNEFVYSLFLTSIKAVTTPTIVQMFIAAQGIYWGEMAAVGTMAILPVLIFAMIVQKNMIRGLSFGAVKG